jgi:hypothetical protein
MVADCEQALQEVTDRRIRDIFVEMRDLWIGVANGRQLFPPARFDAEVVTLGRAPAQEQEPAGRRNRSRWDGRNLVGSSA